MEKIARICWNTRDWKRPSGSEGKSRSSSSYENIIGFGHEEWLLDETKIMPDGYHYAFLQPMNAKAHYGKVYDIHLFTISPDKQKVYVGCLRNAVGVSPEESAKVFRHYRSNGWLQEMKEDVLFAGGTVKDFKPEFLFNVKFKFADADINLSNPPIIKSDSIGHRYNLMDKHGEFEFEMDEAEGKPKTLNTDMFWRTNSAGEILIDPLHKKMQVAVKALLEKEYVHLYLESDLKRDNESGLVDMKGQPVEGNDSWHYFEFKTYSAKRSIREALGQILEYAHYPTKFRAQKLFIIGLEKPDEQDVAYMKLLRETYRLPIWYRWYSFEQNILHEEI